MSRRSEVEALIVRRDALMDEGKLVAAASIDARIGEVVRLPDGSIRPEMMDLVGGRTRR